MKMPNFSKMTVDGLMSARSTIDQLLNKRLPSARKELEKQLSALNNFVGGGSRKDQSQGRRSQQAKRAKGRPEIPQPRWRDVVWPWDEAPLAVRGDQAGS